MAELFTALDNIKEGENKNIEYNWSTRGIENKFVEFYFQLVRSVDAARPDKLKVKYRDLLTEIFLDSNLFNINLLVKMIANTRDIVSGKGEYNLSYFLISELYNFRTMTSNPEKIERICKELITSFVSLPQSHPYGSWKDLKYFLNYHIPKIDRSEQVIYQKRDALLFHIVNLINEQLKKDNNTENKTLLCKWIPREKSKKFGWITLILAIEYFSWNSATTIASENLAKRKRLMLYRKLLAENNIALGTPQINQCNKTWRNIDFEKNVTSITLKKQSKAFALLNKPRRSTLPNNLTAQLTDLDRIECRDNYKAFLENVKQGKATAKGARVSIADFVRDAISILNTGDNLDSDSNNLECDLLNAQWNDNAKLNKALTNCLVMVDTSYSMQDEFCRPLQNAIGLGIRIAEKSSFGKRVLSFSGSPTWINLDDCHTFVEMVQRIMSAQWGTNTNFRGALDKILQSAIALNVHPDTMKNMTLIILSDMQIDAAQDTNCNNTMFDTMEEAYREAGMRSLYKTPYELPHIIFWNLRNTDGFPNLVSTKNTSMMSGSNPSLINSFSDKGIGALKEMTPWSSFVDKLSQERYKYFDKIVNDIFCKRVTFPNH